MLADPASQIRISEWWDDDQAIQSMLSGLRILENSSKIPIPFRIESDSTNRGRKESRQQLSHSSLMKKIQKKMFDSSLIMR